MEKCLKTQFLHEMLKIFRHVDTQEHFFTEVLKIICRADRFFENTLPILSLGAYFMFEMQGGGCHQPVTGVQNQLVHSVSTILGVGVSGSRSKSVSTG